MIVCTIDGKVGIPSSTEKIKVTFENQYVKDSGSYTYDITFPMQIHENQSLFRNVHRFDIKKKLPDYEDCKLYAGNRLVISGKGTVTNITNDTVKMQIVGGKSRIKYNSKFESHYIDEIDYPAVVITKGIERAAYAQIGITEVSCEKHPAMLMVDLTDWNYVGQPGVAAFNPINDEGNNDVIRNNIIACDMHRLKVHGVQWPNGYHAYMYNLAVQPNLMFVLKKVLEYEGYTLVKNDFDTEPWNRLLIASAMQSVRIKDALPHWTVYTFIEEISKFFNASILFDEVEKTVSIISADELTNSEIVSYDCTDDFSSEYEDDGLKNIATSNIQYALDSSTKHDWREYIPLSVLKKYKPKEYFFYNVMTSEAQNMSTRDRRCTLFKFCYDYYIYAMLPADGNPDNSNLTEQITQCGFFNPIIREMESEDFINLKISPVAVYKRRKWNDGDKTWAFENDLFSNSWLFLPSVTNEKQASLDDMTSDDDGEFYTTIQDAMEGGTTEETSAMESESSMAVMFQGLDVINIDVGIVTAYDGRTSADEDWRKRFPITYTDFRMNKNWMSLREKASLTLDTISADVFHAIRSKHNDINIDKHHLIAVNFMTNDIPDPAKIYLFRNKRYICQKIEMEINKGTVDEMKKGYFYEII